jgi:hypothetical protein
VKVLFVLIPAARQRRRGGALRRRPSMERLRRHAPVAHALSWLTLRLPEIWLREPDTGISWNA